MENYVITISRQFASMGRSVAQRISEELGVEFYDRDLVEATAKRMGQRISVISDEEEQRIKFFKRKYPLGMGVANIQDEIFQVQTNIIRDLASKEACIIVGRCGNYILRDHPNALHIFIYAPYEKRLKNCIEELQMKPQNARKMIREVDQAREAYRRKYSKGMERFFDNFDIMIDSSKFGVEGTAELLLQMIEMTVKNQQE